MLYFSLLLTAPVMGYVTVQEKFSKEGCNAADVIERDQGIAVGIFHGTCVALTAPGAGNLAMAYKYSHNTTHQEHRVHMTADCTDSGILQTDESFALDKCEKLGSNWVKRTVEAKCTGTQQGKVLMKQGATSCDQQMDMIFGMCSVNMGESTSSGYYIVNDKLQYKQFSDKNCKTQTSVQDVPTACTKVGDKHLMYENLEKCPAGSPGLSGSTGGATTGTVATGGARSPVDSVSSLVAILLIGGLAPLFV